MPDLVPLNTRRRLVELNFSDIPEFNGPACQLLRTVLAESSLAKRDEITNPVKLCIFRHCDELDFAGCSTGFLTGAVDSLQDGFEVGSNDVPMIHVSIPLNGPASG